MDIVFSFINKYGLIAIFLAIAIEYACFPIPSEVILPLCGAFAFNTNYNFLFVILLSVFASLIGSTICYIIGRTGGVKFINWLKKVYPKSAHGLTEAEAKYQKYSLLSVSLGRIIPLCRTYISFISGSAKQNYFKFLLFSSFGITVWNTILIFLGFKFYENIGFVSSLYNKYKISIIGIFILIFIILLIRLFLKRKKYK